MLRIRHRIKMVTEMETYTIIAEHHYVRKSRIQSTSHSLVILKILFQYNGTYIIHASDNSTLD